MADVSTMAQIVNTVGFPIFMCIVFIIFTYKMLMKFQETISELKTSIDKLYAMITHMEATGEIVHADDKEVKS